MFETAIETISSFTRPLHTVARYYSGLVVPGASTVFFVNDQGVAITCKHVANMIISADSVNQGYNNFRTERNRLPKDGKYPQYLKNLEQKYKYGKESMVQLKTNFRNCFDKIAKIDIHMHPTLDLAILEFKGFEKIFYRYHAVFLKDGSAIRQGKYLCRLGFPFPEFTNFRLNTETDNLEWTSEGKQQSPTFPIDGIVTRFLGDPNGGALTGIEMSTPGLRGQSGGPLFDVDGVIYGMQYATKHLHLGFDLNGKEIIDGGHKTQVSNHPFLHVGLCVHVNHIKEFLKQHNISFRESG